jgi:hypothetical protein
MEDDKTGGINMRFFDRDGKWNWVDENNVFLGYDNMQGCCENAGYTYSVLEPMTEDQIISYKKHPEPDLTNYVFDKAYKKDLDGDFDEGGAVVFCLQSKIAPSDKLYLTLFNYHNGYYGHGFEFSIGGKTAHEGTL